MFTGLIHVETVGKATYFVLPLHRCGDHVLINGMLSPNTTNYYMIMELTRASPLPTTSLTIQILFGKYKCQVKL